MKPDDLIDAMEYISEDLVEEARHHKKTPPAWLRWGSLAICVCCAVLAVGSFVLRQQNSAGEGSAREVGTSETEPECTQEAEPTADSEEDSAVDSTLEDAFFERFYQVDRASMESYVVAHPEVTEEGWDSININESGLDASGTDIYTTQGDQILAINAKEGVLLIRVEAEDSRGVLAICKDTGKLSLCASGSLPDSGETVGEICEANGGILGMTGSAFLDDGTSNGGELSGLAICNGVTMGTPMGGSGDKRLELRDDDLMYIVDSASEVASNTRDACEFHPALIVDGENVSAASTWTSPNPRAALGQSDRLETMMIVMEGRLLDSVGCGVEAVADILERYGCAQAINLDGGTSAIMYYDGAYITRCSNTQLESGRTMPTAWVYGRSED
jgi:exopolysaccharide biosynthesis protein